MYLLKNPRNGWEDEESSGCSLGWFPFSVESIFALNVIWHLTVGGDSSAPEHSRSVEQSLGAG